MTLFVFEFLNYVHVFTFRVDYTWLGRCISTFGMLGALYLLDQGFRRKLGTRLHGAVWVLMTALLWCDFFGDLFHFYSRWMWYDQLMHFLSGVALVISLLLVLKTCAVRLGWKIPTIVLYMLALGGTTTLAVMYELEEYAEDYFFHTNRLGDAFDTVNDLFLNLLASVLTLGICIVWRRFIRSRKVVEQSPV